MARLDLNAIAQELIEGAISCIMDTLEPTISSEISPHDVFQIQYTALKSFETSVNQMVSSKIASIARRTNHFALINNLPEELLVIILGLTINRSELPSKRYEVTGTLNRVCSHWYNAISTNQCFWTHLDGANRRMREMVLRRNKDGPLDVTVDHPVGTDWIPEFGQDSHRWRRMQMTGGNTLNGLVTSHMPTPNLVSLLVDALAGTPGTIPVFTLSEGRSLHYLGLRSATVNWDSSRLRELRYLQVEQLSPGSLSVDQLHSILVASPQLERLLLIGIDGEAAGPSPPSSPILLPHLQAAILHFIPSEMGNHILEWAQASSCSYLSTTGLRFPNNFISSAKLKLCPEKAILVECVVGGEPSINIKSDPKPPDIGLEPFLHEASFGPGFLFSSNTENSSWDSLDPRIRAAVEFARSLETDRLCSIGLQLCYAGHDDPEHPSLFGSGYPWPTVIDQVFPHITSFTCSSHIGHHFLEYLVKFRPQNDGQAEFPCPRLVKLTICPSWTSRRGTEFSVRILQLLAEKRYGLNKDADTPSSPFVQPLEVIEVESSIAVQVRDMGLFPSTTVVGLEE